MVNDSSVEQLTGRRGRVAAIYARVSSDRQRREQTIQSQTVALRGEGMVLSFSRTIWARKELHDEATQAHAGADRSCEKRRS